MVETFKLLHFSTAAETTSNFQSQNKSLLKRYHLLKEMCSLGLDVDAVRKPNLQIRAQDILMTLSNVCSENCLTKKMDEYRSQKI